MTQDQTFNHIRDLMVELFEVDPAKITPDAKLGQDLEIDSIDAIDLVLKLKEYTGRKIKPEEFKHVQTVGDVVNAVHQIVMSAQSASTASAAA